MLNEILIGSVPEVGEEIVEIPASEVPESEISVEISSEPLYCICQEPWDIHNRRFMIHCDHCSDWFHGTCVGINDAEAGDIEKYHCPKCLPTVGPSVLADPETRKPGKRMKSQRCTPEFIAKLKEYKFNIPDEVVLKMRGHNLTLPWLITKGFNRPILVETTEALGMKLPLDTFSVHDVERYVGSERMVDVIDVERQTDILMSMHDFTEYFMSPNRSKLLNLISLEFTHTNLNKLVEGPNITRKLDWVANYWPSNQSSADDDAIRKPAVSKYCLISAKDSYTDFHIDFGGTSVWYHVLWGEKVFYLIEPSEKNLNLYQRWMVGELGEECFLADEVEVCFRLVLKKGQTLLIPTGWIHAVYTPEDSLVFGGNFLHLLNMDLQLQVYDLEKQLRTPAKYLFPSFEATHWYAAEGIIQDLETLNSSSCVPAYLVRGLKALVEALKVWHGEKEIGKLRREYIPGKINCKKILQDLNKELRLSERRVSVSSHSHKDFTSKDPKDKDSKLLKQSMESPLKSSRETSPTLVFGSPESMKRGLSRTSSVSDLKSPATSPNSTIPGGLAPIKLKIKKQSSGPRVPGSGNNSPNSPRVKLRLSLSEGKAESIDCDSNTGSDALYIVESDVDERRLETDGSVHSSEGLVIDVSATKNKKRHHHKKCKRNKTGKAKHDRSHNKAINDMLAGTLDGLEELFKSSNYTERISKCENTSQAIKDSVADMDAMKGTILPLKKRHKKKKHHGQGGDSDSDVGIEKVHQDDDYIYLPLAGSDDESPTRSGKKSKRGRKREDDDTWSPKIKVGLVGKRDNKSNRVNAKREAVEKGLEKAAATLKHGHNNKKRKSKDDPEVKHAKKQRTTVPSSPSVKDNLLAGPANAYQQNQAKSNSLAKKFADASSSSAEKGTPKKPKKGMATAKQRLGRILKINKFARF